jgi:glycerol-3-phosphate dehydrogenase (NAD(P)+)
MDAKVTVIGDGGMGTVCASMLAENGATVTLWSAFPDQADELARHRENRRFLPGLRLPEGVTVTADDAEALARPGWILSAVPSQFVREVWNRLAPHVPADLPICSVTKGIENETLLRPSEVLADVQGPTIGPLAVLSGPSIAPEIAQGLPASVVVASPDADLADRIQRAVARPTFRVYTNDDLPGVELAGATKNVIAIAAGVLDGLAFGTNAKAALLARGLAEISRLGEACGAKPGTFAGLAGMGDLVTTCFAPSGRNRTFGQAIGQGATVEESTARARGVVEGLATTRSVLQLADRHGVDMPLTRAVADVLFENRPPREAIADLMTRPLRAEV